MKNPVFTALLVLSLLGVAPAAVPLAQPADSASAATEEVVVVGSRREGCSSFDSPAPVAHVQGQGKGKIYYYLKSVAGVAELADAPGLGPGGGFSLGGQVPPPAVV